ncbi:hypothetical protein [Amycolatopsis sp. cmx-4-61]
MRITLDEDTATVRCYAMAQYFRPGELRRRTGP